MASSELIIPPSCSKSFSLSYLAKLRAIALCSSSSLSRAAEYDLSNCLLGTREIDNRLTLTFML